MINCRRRNTISGDSNQSKTFSEDLEISLTSSEFYGDNYDI